MLGYVKEDVVDEGLIEILHRFETLYPYLVLIAASNGMNDPFDRKVVEAYWLGNKLLGQVKGSSFANHLTDALKLKMKIPMSKLTPMMNHVIDGVPQHNFHVMNIFIRTGHETVTHTLSTMDECRISWGRLVGEFNNTKMTKRQYIVRTQPLVYEREKLTLGVPVNKIVTDIAMSPKIGQWVSLHWGYICDVLTMQQLQLLKKHTALALSFANTTV